MFPLTLLKAAVGHAILVELRNGETYNGQLLACDPWMNLNLTLVTCTSRDGDRFWKLPIVHIRGNNIKYMCVPDNVLADAHEVEKKALKKELNRNQKRGGSDRGRGVDRGGRGGRGSDRGSRGGSDRGGRGGRGSDRGGRGGRGSDRGGRGGSDRGRGYKKV